MAVGPRRTAQQACGRRERELGTHRVGGGRVGEHLPGEREAQQGPAVGTGDRLSGARTAREHERGERGHEGALERGSVTTEGRRGEQQQAGQADTHRCPTASAASASQGQCQSSGQESQVQAGQCEQVARSGAREALAEFPRHRIGRSQHEGRAEPARSRGVMVQPLPRQSAQPRHDPAERTGSHGAGGHRDGSWVHPQRGGGHSPGATCRIVAGSRPQSPVDPRGVDARQRVSSSLQRGGSRLPAPGPPNGRWTRPPGDQGEPGEDREGEPGGAPPDGREPGEPGEQGSPAECRSERGMGHGSIEEEDRHRAAAGEGQRHVEEGTARVGAGRRPVRARARGRAVLVRVHRSRVVLVRQPGVVGLRPGLSKDSACS